MVHFPTGLQVVTKGRACSLFKRFDLPTHPPRTVVKFNRFVVGSCAPLLFLSSQALAADFEGKFGGWEVHSNDDNCTAIKEFEGPGDTQFSLLKFTDGRVGAVIWNFNWSAKKGEQYDVALSLAERTYRGTGVGVENIIHKGFALGLDSAFATDFAKGSSLHVFLGTNRIDQLSLDGTAAAMAAVDRCLNKLRARIAEAEREKARWAHLPEDPFASPEPQAKETAPLLDGSVVKGPKPRGISGSWANANDYPSRALREEREGVTKFTLTVGPDGRATSCVVTGSSGSADLDATTCSLNMRRARFDPATDQNGGPVPSEWSSATRWEIPR